MIRQIEGIDLGRTVRRHCRYTNGTFRRAVALLAIRVVTMSRGFPAAARATAMDLRILF